jgi:hypothetical protein
MSYQSEMADALRAMREAKFAANSSDGGGEQTRYSVQEGASYSKTQANAASREKREALPSKRSYRSKGEEAPSGPRVESKIEAVGVAPGPSDSNSGAPLQPRGEPVQSKSTQQDVIEKGLMLGLLGWIVIGIIIMSCGAYIVWGYGGVLLVLGGFVAIMSGVEYWAELPKAAEANKERR